MGYYANYSGNITFNERPSGELLHMVNTCFQEFHYDENRRECEFSGYEKYYEERIKNPLTLIKDITKLGEINFNGDDGKSWRFFFKDGEWIEEDGIIYYESEIPLNNKDEKEEFLGRLIDIAQDCLDNPEDETIQGEWYDKVKDEFAAVLKAYKVIK